MTLPSLSVDQLQNQLLHIHDNRAPQMVATTISFMIVSTISVFLRIISRRLQGLRLGADDYMIVVSLVCHIPILVGG